MTEEFEVYRYIVCWKEPMSYDWEWKHKDFANKKDAKAFARKHKNKKPYPYIIQRITPNTYFKNDIVLERIKKKHNKTYYIVTHNKIIKY
jgi:hypothetical protein